MSLEDTTRVWLVCVGDEERNTCEKGIVERRCALLRSTCEHIRLYLGLVYI